MCTHIVIYGAQNVTLIFKKGLGHSAIKLNGDTLHNRLRELILIHQHNQTWGTDCGLGVHIQNSLASSNRAKEFSMQNPFHYNFSCIL